MSERDDLLMLHALAMQNTAHLTFDEKSTQMKHYQEHKLKCHEAYGFSKTWDAEYYGLPDEAQVL